jgi:hypothetical protein
VESDLYVKKKYGTKYGVSGMRDGRKGCEWLQKEGSRCDYLLNRWELPHFRPIWTDSSIESPGFFIMKHTFCSKKRASGKKLNSMNCIFGFFPGVI